MRKDAAGCFGRPAEDRAVTTITNSFYRNANAASYASLLFTGSTSSAAPPSATRQSVTSTDSDTTAPTAAQKALARITEILALGNGASQDDAGSVSESFGYITDASGTEKDDKLTMTGRGVYHLESGDGNDTVMLKSAAMSGIDLGDGDDSLQAKGELANGISAGSGNDKIELAAKLAMDVSGGDGADDIKVSADTMIGIDGGDGDDTMYLEGNRIFATGGDGNDTVTIHQTQKSGTDGVAEYTFAKGGGQDTVATDGPLSVRFDGYAENDLSISVTGNVLTAKVNGSDDKITVTLSDDAMQSGTLSYGFKLDQGQTVLTIG